MKTKKVNRYYCDYCKKAGCNKYWIRKHEERCTKNPNRYCGFCHLLDQDQTDLKQLIALLPEPNEYIKYFHSSGEGFVGLEQAVNKILPKIRDIAGNCPACIMAALRQGGIPVPMATEFNFKKECSSIWDDFNASEQQKDRDEIYYSQF